MKKKILLIATGGTIASQHTEEGLAPQMGAEDILRYVPGVQELCQIESIPLLNVDSTDMEPKHWLLIAQCIEENYETYDGFVVLHGTDTMSYTAAALSYLIQNSKKPIVLTGAQRPIEREATDAIANMIDSFVYACDEESWGVTIIFGGQVILGTRAKKIRTKSFNAFSSMNYPEIAFIRDGHIVRYIKETVEGLPKFYHNLNTKVFLLKLIPGISPEIFQYLKKDYDAIIMESFGVGGVPSYEGTKFEQEIQSWIEEGKLLVITTQVPQEGSDLGVYSVGQRYKNQYNLLEAYDMTLEATIAKLMWILGETKDRKEIEKQFYIPVNHDILFP